MAQHGTTSPRRRQPGRFWAHKVVGLVPAVMKRCGLGVMLVYRRPLPTGYQIPDDIRTRFRFTRLAGSDLDALTSRPELGVSHSFVIESTRRGAVCFAVLNDDGPVAYLWYGTGQSMPHLPGLNIGYDAGRYVYGFKIFTHPDFRGMRLARHLAGFADAQLRERGFTYVLGFTELQNVIARRAARHFGTHEYCGFAITLRRRGGRYRGWVSPRLTRFGFRFDSQAPESSASTTDPSPSPLGER